MSAEASGWGGRTITVSLVAFVFAPLFGLVLGLRMLWKVRRRPEEQRMSPRRGGRGREAGSNNNIENNSNNRSTRNIRNIRNIRNTRNTMNNRNDRDNYNNYNSRNTYNNYNNRNGYNNYNNRNNFNNRDNYNNRDIYNNSNSSNNYSNNSSNDINNNINNNINNISNIISYNNNSNNSYNNSRRVETPQQRAQRLARVDRLRNRTSRASPLRTEPDRPPELTWFDKTIQMVDDHGLTVVRLLVSILGLLIMARIVQEDGWTPLIDAVSVLLVAAAVLAATRCLRWGLFPSVEPPLSNLIIAVELFLIFVLSRHVSGILVAKSDPSFENSFDLAAIASMLLALGLRGNLSCPFGKWKASVCVVAGEFFVWWGVITFWWTVPSEGALEVFVFLTEALARMSREVTRATIVFLWPFTPGLWQFTAVVIASLLGSAIVLGFINKFPDTRGPMVCYARGFMPASLLVCYCSWGDLPRIAMGLAMAVLWLLGLMLIHLCPRFRLGQGVTLWPYLPCAAPMLAWTLVLGRTHDSSDERYHTLMLVFKVLWACEMAYKELIPAGAKRLRDYMASGNPRPAGHRPRDNNAGAQ